jgi:hypothetical protein
MAAQRVRQEGRLLALQERQGLAARMAVQALGQRALVVTLVTLVLRVLPRLQYCRQPPILQALLPRV